MATRRVTTYARAYSFGTDGSAALAGAPIASTRPLASRPQHAPSEKTGLRMPLWALVLAVAGVVFVLSFMLLGLRSDASGAQKQINSLRLEIARTQEVIDALEVQIASAGDPARIHSIAVNRLGMRLPQEGQVFTVPRPSVPALATETAQQSAENRGFFSLLLSLMGL